MSIAPEQQAQVQALMATAWPNATWQRIEKVQSLWSDFGAIVRVHMPDNSSAAVPSTAIAKVVKPPLHANHPRGWDTDASRQRKLRSYTVEAYFYASLAHRCPSACRVPQCFGVAQQGDAVSMLLEDLDREFPQRRAKLSVVSVQVCLSWLASFHAQWMGVVHPEPIGIGTYWHLQTRQDEFKAMPEGSLKSSAIALDQALNHCRFKTLLHGDAKVANFCFSADGSNVAAVDFQYVGVGCGMRDVAYLLGSCLAETELETHEEALLDSYFTVLGKALQLRDEAADTLPVIHDIEAEWRPLYAVAGADFHRFLEGWSPGHAKLTGYSAGLVKRAQQYLNDAA